MVEQSSNQEADLIQNELTQYDTEKMDPEFAAAIEEYQDQFRNTLNNSDQ